MYRRTLVGNCVDVDPIPEGKIVAVLDGSEDQVKVALTDVGGRQSMTFMPLDIALRNHRILPQAGFVEQRKVKDWEQFPVWNGRYRGQAP